MTERPAPERAATERALEAAFAGATRYVRSLPERPVAARAGAGELLARLGGPLPDGPSDPAEVIAQAEADRPVLLRGQQPLDPGDREDHGDDQRDAERDEEAGLEVVAFFGHKLIADMVTSRTATRLRVFGVKDA